MKNRRLNKYDALKGSSVLFLCFFPFSSRCSILNYSLALVHFYNELGAPKNTKSTERFILARGYCEWELLIEFNVDDVFHGEVFALYFFCTEK